MHFRRSNRASSPLRQGAGRCCTLPEAPPPTGWFLSFHQVFLHFTLPLQRPAAHKLGAESVAVRRMGEMKSEFSRRETAGAWQSPRSERQKGEGTGPRSKVILIYSGSGPLSAFPFELVCVPCAEKMRSRSRQLFWRDRL